jgi:hypothetical protein
MIDDGATDVIGGPRDLQFGQVVDSSIVHSEEPAEPTGLCIQIRATPDARSRAPPYRVGNDETDWTETKMGTDESATQARTGRASPTSRGGLALTVTGAIHTVYGLVAYGATLADIAGDGVFNAVGSSAGPDRDAALWFLVTGVLLIVLGRFARWAQRVTGTLPPFVGWSVIGVAVLVGVLVPASGWPLVAVSGVLLLGAGRRA